MANVTDIPLSLADPYEAMNSVVIAVSLSAMCLTTGFMIVRAASLLDIGKFERDDAFLTVAYFLNLIGIILLLVQDTQGVLNFNESTVFQAGLVVAQEGLALEVLYCFTVFFARTAVLLQLIRVFAPSKKGAMYMLCNVLIGITFCFYVASGITTLVQCRPFQKIWDPLTPGTCGQRFTMLIATGAINVFSDAIIFLLPLAALWRLEPTTKFRADVVGVFAAGGMSVVTSVGRTVYTVLLPSSTNPGQTLVEIEIWTTFEVTLLVICPTFLFVPRFIRILRGQSQAARTQRSKEGQTSNSTVPESKEGGQYNKV